MVASILPVVRMMGHLREGRQPPVHDPVVQVRVTCKQYVLVYDGLEDWSSDIDPGFVFI